MRPSINPRLAHLRHLTVRYSSVSTTDETNRLCRWVRRVIANAPLETLRLICENETDGVAVSFHPLVEHLSAKHATRLRILDMPGCYVPKDALSKLCRTCTALEEVALSISTDTLVSSCLPYDPRTKYSTHGDIDRISIIRETLDTPTHSDVQHTEPLVPLRHLPGPCGDAGTQRTEPAACHRGRASV